MATDMTDEQREARDLEIRERTGRATAGPWAWEIEDKNLPGVAGSFYPEALVTAAVPYIDGYQEGPPVLLGGGTILHVESGKLCIEAPDATFMAHARMDIPWLLAERRRLAERVKYLADHISRWSMDDHIKHTVDEEPQVVVDENQEAPLDNAGTKMYCPHCKSSSVRADGVDFKCLNCACAWSSLSPQAEGTKHDQYILELQCRVNDLEQLIEEFMRAPYDGGLVAVRMKAARLLGRVTDGLIHLGGVVSRDQEELELQCCVNDLEHLVEEFMQAPYGGEFVDIRQKAARLLGHVTAGPARGGVVPQTSDVPRPPMPVPPAGPAVMDIREGQIPPRPPIDPDNIGG